MLSGTVLFMMRQENEGSAVPQYNEGQVARETVRVKRATEIVDQDASEAAKVQILSRVMDVYDYDRSVALVWTDRWKMAIRHLRVLRTTETKLEARAAAFATKAGIVVSPAEFAELEKIGFTADLERSVYFALGPLWEQRIIDKKIPLTYSIEIVDIKTAKSESLRPSELGRLLSVEDAAALVGKGKSSPLKIRGRDQHRLPWSKWNAKQKSLVFALQARLVQPNVTLNRKETEVRRETALQNFSPLIQKLAKGEVVVREGERVSRKSAQTMRELNKNVSEAKASDTWIYKALFSAFSAWLIAQFLRRQYPRLLRSPKDIGVMAFWYLTSLACFKLTLIFMLDVLADKFSMVPAAFFFFLAPIATPAMILRLLLNPSMTMLFTLVYALTAGLLLEKAALFGVYILASCVMSSWFIARCRTRTSLYWAGIKTALICGVMAVALMAAWEFKLPLALSLLGEDRSAFESLFATAIWAFAGGLVGGWLSSVLTLVLTPLLENFLDYTTDLKLLELARMDHPLLRDLVLKAPGTYHHSIIVGSLVEAGAEAIGANALLARVGSYYHDIGKIGRAEYFIENQSRGENPHDNTRPQLSAKIIISHVKEGRALAEHHKLGQNLIDFIEQHHGTSLVSYFYNKAMQDAAQPGSSISPEEVREEDFRYPGPKPQSKENAILALADSCEAATRSLVDPTPARIEGMVKKIIQKAFSEGVLEEADITLREVHLVAGAFVRILLGIHHNRIQYPDQEKDLPPNTLPLVKGGR